MPIQVASLLVQVGANVAPAQRALNSLAGQIIQFQKTASRSQQIFSGFSKFGTGILGGFAGASIVLTLQGIARALGEIGREAFDSYAYTEKLQISLRAMTARELIQGGQATNMADALQMATGRAQELTQWVRQLSLQSPFNREGVAEAFRLAQAYGFTSEEAQRLTQVVVDFTAATGQSEAIIKRVNLALGQIRTRGKLSAQELRQLSEAGVSTSEVLASAFGASKGEITKWIEDGLVPADLAVEAIIRSLEEFYGGSAKRATFTFDGMIERIRELKLLTLENLFGPAFEAARPGIASVAEILESDDFQDGVKELGRTIGEIANLSITTLVADIERVTTALEGKEQEPAWLKVLAGIGAIQGGTFEITPKIITGDQPFDVPVQATVTKVDFDPEGNYSWTYDSYAKVTSVDWFDEANREGFNFVYDAEAGIKRVDWYAGPDGIANFTYVYDAEAKIGKIYTDPNAEVPVVQLVGTVEEGFIAQTTKRLGDAIGARINNEMAKVTLTITAAQFVVSSLSGWQWPTLPTWAWPESYPKWEYPQEYPKWEWPVLPPWEWPVIRSPAWLQKFELLGLVVGGLASLGSVLVSAAGKFEEVRGGFDSIVGSLSGWQWPTLPVWTWPTIPTPGWLDSLLRALGLASAAAERGPSNTHSFPRKPIYPLTYPDGSGSGAIPGLDKMGRATGDPHFRGGWAVVGEEGPELVRLPAGVEIYSNPISQQLMAAAAALRIPFFQEGTTSNPPDPFVTARDAFAKYRSGAINREQLRATLGLIDELSDNTDAVKASNRNAEIMADAFRSAVESTPGLFGTSEVTADQMRLADLGIPQNFADDYVRRLTDEVVNGTDWEGVDIRDAATRAGLDPNLPADVILELFKQAWNDSSLFANADNLDLINKDAVQQSIQRQQAALQGQSNVLALFGIEDKNLDLQVQGLSAALSNGLIANTTPEQFAPVGDAATAGIAASMSDPERAADTMTKVASAYQSALGAPTVWSTWQELGKSASDAFNTGFAPGAPTQSATPEDVVPTQKVPAFSAGTKFFGGGLAIVGDPDRPELVQLPAGARIYSNSEMDRMGMGGVTINMGGVTIANRGDADYLVHQMKQELSRWRPR